MKPTVAIDPDTKVADLLAAYPELEEVLIETSPAFQHLRNPVLRRTVAKVATIQRIAGVGGLELRELIQTLRRAAGLDDEEAETGADQRLSHADQEKLALESEGENPLLDRVRLVETIDADAMLARGETPLSPILQRSRRLDAGEMVCVTSAFRPAPLIDALAREGLRCITLGNDTAGFETFILRDA